jgi:lipopolysaccharide/colanic/teichoic acid biosynthesis glycosyltransferase
MIPNADDMRDEVIEQAGEDPRHPKLRDDPRVTRVGRFIRRASLDELPNIFNVIKGEMSLVGPRPPLPEEVALYEPWHLRRLQIIPGMTGLWQVSGRSEIPFDEMCLMDIYYIENWSIKFDVQILMMTVPRVLLRSGAY